ncbi:MAG TPA: DinB family protein [Vicinamibacterales bacterium]|nr:DinB family protein [Vicinamibacterales bacterium]
MTRNMLVLTVLIGGVIAVGVPQAQQGGGANPLAATIRANWQAARLNIKESADQMTADKYGYKPVPTVRNFGEILTHLAGANYIFCAAAKGEKAPHAEDAFEKSVTARDQIIKVLAESLAYCDSAYTAATDASLAQMVAQPFSTNQGPRANALIGNIGHLNEHYGNLVTYFRMNNMVPPSSKR